MKIERWNKKDTIFDGHLDAGYAMRDQCDVFYIADHGFCVLNTAPKYPLYARMGLCEIQDVFVLPQCRGQGVAKMLIAHCEDLCREKGHSMVGISVPVSPQFGAAQCLYAGMGYRPDGNGVTYDRAPVIHNERYTVDENLCLMLVKDLQ